MRVRTLFFLLLCTGGLLQALAITPEASPRIRVVSEGPLASSDEGDEDVHVAELREVVVVHTPVVTQEALRLALPEPHYVERQRALNNKLRKASNSAQHWGLAAEALQELMALEDYHDYALLLHVILSKNEVHLSRMENIIQALADIEKSPVRQSGVQEALARKYWEFKPDKDKVHRIERWLKMKLDYYKRPSMSDIC